MKTEGLEMLLAGGSSAPRYQTERFGAFNGDPEIKSRLIARIEDKGRGWPIDVLIREEAGGYLSQSETMDNAFLRITGLPMWMVDIASSVGPDDAKVRDTVKRMLEAMNVGGSADPVSLDNLVASGRLHSLALLAEDHDIYDPELGDTDADLLGDAAAFIEGDPDNKEIRDQLIANAQSQDTVIGKLIVHTLKGGEDHVAAAGIFQGIANSAGAETENEHETLVSAVMWLTDGADDVIASPRS